MLKEMVELYCDKKLTGQQVADQLGCSQHYVHKTLASVGLARSRSEARKLSLAMGRSTMPIDGFGNRGNWKGGRWQDKHGYIWLYMPEHPRAKGNYVQEHLVVWEEAHGKPLPKGWVVHHLNGTPFDNRPVNLLGMEGAKHNRLIAEYQNRINELETENTRLIKALRAGQSILSPN